MPRRKKPRELGFAICVAIATGVMFGVAPAVFPTKASPADALRSGTPDDGGRVFTLAAWAGQASGGVVSGTAGGRGALFADLASGAH